MAVHAADPDLSWMYRDTRERLIRLLPELDGAALATRVPACPASSVREVVAHLTAVSQDVRAGRPTGIPPERETAAQVARFKDHDLAGILAVWEEVAPHFERLVGTIWAWPTVIDIASHEHDPPGPSDDLRAGPPGHHRVAAPRFSDAAGADYCTLRCLLG